MLLHVLFSVLGWLIGAASGWILRRRHGTWLPPVPSLWEHPFYFSWLVLGAGAGSLGLGSLNLWLSGIPSSGSSVLGGMIGGLFLVEGYKCYAGIRHPTGVRFVLPLALGIAIGRWGCFLSGLSDNTHGSPTSLPWGYDYGDGLLRHPVQLYESAALLIFAGLFLHGLEHRRAWVLHHGFNWFLFYYGTQRFLWEFVKPYATLLGPFNLFHVACLGLASFGLSRILRMHHVS